MFTRAPERNPKKPKIFPEGERGNKIISLSKKKRVKER